MFSCLPITHESDNRGICLSESHLTILLYQMAHKCKGFHKYFCIFFRELCIIENGEIYENINY